MFVEGTDMRVTFKAAGRPDNYQMRIMLDAAHHGPGGAYRDFRPGANTMTAASMRTRSPQRP